MTKLIITVLLIIIVLFELFYVINTFINGNFFKVFMGIEGFLFWGYVLIKYIQTIEVGKYG